MQKIQSGVVINFEKTGPDPPPTEGKGGPGFFYFIFFSKVLINDNITVYQFKL